jgi:hypothetical protein
MYTIRTGGKIVRKKIVILTTALIILIQLIGCSNNQTEPSSESVPPSKVVDETGNKGKFEAYTSLLEDFTNNITIKGFRLIPPVKTIFLIDKELTFNKKDTITYGGGQNDFDPTQQLFVFENSDKSTQLYVSISYTNVDMGKNLVAWDIPAGDNDADQKLINQIQMATYTYRNLIVTITQNSKTNTDLDGTKEAARSVLKILDKYYEKK